MSLTLAAITKFLPEVLVGYFLSKGMDKYLDSTQSIEDELRKVIDETIIEYSDADQCDYTNKLPFYHSVNIITELLKFRVMAPEDYQYEELEKAISVEQNVTLPTEKELSNFFDLFMAKVNQSEVLKRLEIKETYSQEVFKISGMIKDLSSRFDNLDQIYTGDLEVQWKDRVDTYIKTLNDFKPATALKLLESLELSLQSSSKRPGTHFMAYLEYQKGRCYGFLARKEDCFRSTMKAWQMDKSNILYAQTAAISLFRMNDDVELTQLIADILKLDLYNPVAWALRILRDITEDLDVHIMQIPKLVQNDSTFQRVIYNEAKGRNRSILHVKELVPSCFNYKDKEVTIDGYYEAIFWINSTMQYVFSVYLVDYVSNNQDHKEEVAILNKMLTRLLEKVRGSEMKDDFRHIEFLYSFTEFILTGEQKRALEMEAIYMGKLNREQSMTIYTANSLQLSGLVDRAILLLEKETELNTEALLLMLLCYQKKEDMVGYCEAAKKFSKSIVNFESRHLLMYINLMVEIRLLGQAVHFEVEDFTSGKTFADEEEGKLVGTVAALIFDVVAEDELSYLRLVATESEDALLVDILGSAFFAAGVYDLALETLARNLEGKMAGRELYQYIHSHNKTGKDYKELLKLLENWRLTFPFNAQFLMLEIQLRQDLVDWQEVVTICEFYLDQIPDDPTILAIYVNGLHLLNNNDSNHKIDGIVARVRNCEFKQPEHLIIICNVLYLHGMVEQAFELMYPHALDSKAVKIRASYAKLVFHSSDMLMPLVEYEIAEVGSFVKFVRDEHVSYIELVDDSLEHPVYKLFLGKKQDDIVSVKRNLGNITDTFIIKRIMNKYLALFDQILNQSNEDPYAGLPFSMMKFDTENPGSFIEMMQSMFGNQHQIAEQSKDADFDAYYNGGLSLTEIVIRRYDEGYINGYYNLIIYHNGINTISRSVFSNHLLSDQCQVVIDYSSLLLFYQIWLFHKRKFQKKFILSKYVLERIKLELSNLQYGVDPFNISNIEIGRIPISDPSFEFQKKRESYLIGLVEWIDLNCEVQLSDNTIEAIKKANINIGKNPILDASISTLLLVKDDENRMLITDDSFYLRMNLLPIERIMSSEHYLKLIVSEDATILDELIKNRHIKYSPNARQLDDEYMKMLSGSFSNYSLLLENLSITNSRENLDNIMGHLKEITLKPMLTREQVIRDTSTVFVRILKGRDSSFIDLFERKVYLDFKLLGNMQDDVLFAFDNARMIIHGS